ncbi:hypothetical protein ACR3IL_11365 [Streptococcus iniae]|uniref:hypothetical protein n=1 Tax=Streptococcus iniae TaxID=1346 RepID=UPI00037F5FE2|nr:hypothetical protein [Streptococcus iniae]ESR08758.1 hypothetical protein IUSA1_10715 [Streptococcus iniae IUSA1]
MKRYLQEENLQKAMAEYTSLHKGVAAFTPNGKSIGQVSHFYNNINGNGEQVYASV